MSVTATGILSVPMAKLATMLRASTAWQAWIAAVDETAYPDQAADPIWMVQISKAELDDNDVLAIIDQPPVWERNAVAWGSQNTFGQSGALMFGVLSHVPSAYTAIPSDAVLWFTNLVGAVLSDVLALAAVSDNLPISKVSLSDLYRCQPEMRSSEGDWIKADFIIEWRGVG